MLTEAHIGTVVGHITLGAGARYTQLYEVAAWYREHEFQPGTYPITLTKYPYGGYFLVCRDVPTKIVAASLRSLFGGVGYGEDSAGKREVGIDATADLKLAYGQDTNALVPTGPRNVPCTITMCEDYDQPTNNAEA